MKKVNYRTNYISVIFLTIYFNGLLFGPSNPIRTFSFLADKQSKKQFQCYLNLESLMRLDGKKVFRTLIILPWLQTISFACCTWLEFYKLDILWWNNRYRYLYLGGLGCKDTFHMLSPSNLLKSKQRTLSYLLF